MRPLYKLLSHRKACSAFQYFNNSQYVVATRYLPLGSSCILEDSSIVVAQLRDVIYKYRLYNFFLFQSSACRKRILSLSSNAYSVLFNLAYTCGGTFCTHEVINQLIHRLASSGRFLTKWSTVSTKTETTKIV